MRRAVTPAQRREVVALAAVVGAEAAAAQLGWDARTVRKWSAQAGDPPELDGNAAAWQRAFDLAHAKVEGILASGKASAVTAATIMGIAQRNLRDIDRGQRPHGAESAVSVRETFFDWLAERVHPEAIDEPTTGALVAAVGDVQSGLLIGRANAEPHQPHRPAILAWFSGREVPAGDVLDWAMAQVEDAIATHGSLIAWHAWLEEQDAEDQRRLEEQLERNRISAERAIAASRQAQLDNETRSLLAAAEAFLRKSADA